MQKIKSFNQPGLEDIVYEIKKYSFDSKIIKRRIYKIDYFTKYIDPKFSSSFWRRVNI